MDKSIRRSTRIKKMPASYSPPPSEKLSSSGKGRKKAKCGQDTKKTEDKDYTYDVTPDGQPFTCDMCGSPYVIDPYKRKKTGITKRLLPRQRLDPATGQHLMLCNACGIAKMRQTKSSHRPRIKYVAMEEEKEQYLKEAKAFADSLVASLGDSAAEKLYCPRFTSKPCRCIQTYLINGDDSDGYRQRAIYLIKLIRLAQQYSSLKCYDINDIIGPDGKKGKVGMGRGHKKSKVYEDFVMTRRTQLKNQYNLCEVAIKKILCYSNNFLFKKLKSQESECRIEKVKGRGKKSANLIPIDKLAQEKCCHGKCTVMALSHMTLLQEWRDRAGQGQSEARRVIAEMLTPSGLHTNCYAFIRMVTGVTSTVISSVSNYMRETGGRRDPPPHGLKTFWENHPKRRKLDSKAENMKPSQDNIVEVIVSVPENDRLIVSDQRRSDAVASNDPVEGNPPNGVAVMTDASAEGKALCLADTSQRFEQVTSNPSSATNVMVLESGGTLSTPDDHLELMPFCNPDGSTQLIQVPIIAYSNLEGDNLLQDLNLQIPVDPGSLVLDGSSSFLDNNGIIVDVPTLPHTMLQNPSAARSQVIPESGPQIAAMDTTALKEASQCNETQIQDLIVMQSSSDASRKCEIKMLAAETEFVLKNRDSDLKDTVQATPQQSDAAEIRQQVFTVSNDGDEPAVRMLNITDSQMGEFNINKDSSLAGLKNPFSTNVCQHFLADAFYKIQNNMSSSELRCSLSDSDLALQGNTLCLDSSKVLPSALRPLQGTSSLPCPPNAEVLSTRNCESTSTSTVHTSQYLVSSVSTSSDGSVADVCKIKSPAPNIVVISSQQHPSASSVQTARAESMQVAPSLLASLKDSKTCLPPNLTLLVPEQVVPVSSSSTQLDGKNVKLIDKNILGMVPTSVAIRETLCQPTVVKSVCVTAQSGITVNSGQSISHILQPKGKPTEATLPVKELASVPVKRTCVDGVSTMRLATATKLHLVTTTTTTTVGQPGKASATTISSSVGDRHQTGHSKPGTIPQSKCSDHIVLGGSMTQPSILPKPMPSGTLATHFPPDVSLPVIVSTAAPSQVVLSPGIVPSSVPGVMLSSLVNPMPQFVMPIVNNRNIDKVTVTQPSESLHVSHTAALKGAAPVQGLQFASGNTIILHNATSQRGGSFSLQHLANQRTGSIAVEHGQGSIYITRTPNSDIQFVQPVMPRVVVPPAVEQMKSVQQTTGGIMTVPLQQALAPVTTDQLLLQTVATILSAASTSSRKHLKEMLPVLPTTITTSKHTS